MKLPAETSLLPPLPDPPRGRGRPAAETRKKILLAAESLFAESGVDAVSLRQITAAAGQANSYAAQYHFGDKEQLLQAIFEYRSLQFEPMRSRMLQELHRTGRTGDAKSLIEIMCYPYVAARNEAGQFSFAALMAQYLTKLRSSGVPHPLDDALAAPALRELRALFVRRLGHLDEALAWRRVSMATLTFCGVLLRAESGGDVAADADAFRLMVMDTVEQMAAAVCAPAAYGRDGLFSIPI